MTGKIIIRVWLLLLLTAFLGNCGTVKGWFSSKKPEKPPDIMADEGIKHLKKKKYDEAIETFEKIRDRYPYSEQALLAQIKVADAYFFKKKYDEALAAYKEFEKLHPTNRAVPYCIFRQGMCNFRQRSTIDRDQTFTKKAMQEFTRLKKKFPQCEYIPKADKYLARCRQDLAENEFYIAEFYFKTKRYKAALDRYQAVAQDYPDFPKQAQVGQRLEQCRNELSKEEKPKGGIFSGITSIFDARW